MTKTKHVSYGGNISLHNFMSIHYLTVLETIMIAVEPQHCFTYLKAFVLHKEGLDRFDVLAIVNR